MVRSALAYEEEHGIASESATTGTPTFFRIR